MNIDSQHLGQTTTAMGITREMLLRPEVYAVAANIGHRMAPSAKSREWPYQPRNGYEIGGYTYHSWGRRSKDPTYRQICTRLSTKVTKAGFRAYMMRIITPFDFVDNLRFYRAAPFTEIPQDFYTQFKTICQYDALVKSFDALDVTKIRSQAHVAAAVTVLDTITKRVFEIINEMVDIDIAVVHRDPHTSSRPNNDGHYWYTREQLRDMLGRRKTGLMTPHVSWDNHHILQAAYPGRAGFTEAQRDKLTKIWKETYILLRAQVEDKLAAVGQALSTKETPLKQTEFDTNPYENPFLIYDPDRSVQEDAPVFRNVATNRVTAYSAFPKFVQSDVIPQSAYESRGEFYAQHRYVPGYGGAAGQVSDEGVNLLPWLAGGVAAAVLASQVL